MANRKYVRIALSENDEALFAAAKEKAEAQTGITMSDSMFALSVLRRALAAHAHS